MFEMSGHCASRSGIGSVSNVIIRLGSGLSDNCVPVYIERRYRSEGYCSPGNSHGRGFGWPILKLQDLGPVFCNLRCS
jgi:hypothetical protein